MIKIGQLRRWTNGGDREADAFLNVGEMFLVTGYTKAANCDDMFVDYVMNGKLCWDDDDWVESYSEVVNC